ncbi:MAG: type II secretion system protein GspG [Bacillota bacterium]
MFFRLMERLGCRVKDERGLTLIELVAVVVILGIVAAVLIPRVLGRADAARESRAMSDIGAMKSVLETYYADYGVLPDSGTIDDVMRANGVNWTGSSGGVTDPWDNGYGYDKIDDDSYKIASKGRDETKGSGDDIYASETLSPTKGDSNLTSVDAVSDGSSW